MGKIQNRKEKKEKVFVTLNYVILPRGPAAQALSSRNYRILLVFYKRHGSNACSEKIKQSFVLSK